MPTARRAVSPRSGRRRPRQGRLRPQLPRETPIVVTCQQFARFTSIDPDENRRRFYLLTWQPSLFGGGVLVRTWGRIGTHGRSRSTSFPVRTHAQASVERLIRQRIRRGYELASWT